MRVGQKATLIQGGYHTYLRRGLPCSLIDMDKTLIVLLMLTTVLVYLQSPQLVLMLGGILAVSIVTTRLLFWLGSALNPPETLIFHTK